MRRALFLVFGCGLVLLQGCSNLATAPVAAPASGADATINLAIYPYVPRPDQFKAAISAAWQEEEPEVEIRFVDWDCYSSDPPDDLDVFAFDAVFLDYLRSKGFLESIAYDEIENPADILPYALRGIQVDDKLYGIPQLGCGSVLFYRQGDSRLAEATTLSEVMEAIGECTYSGLTPPPNTGLMVDLSGGTTDAGLYLDAVEEISGQYAADPPLPPDANKIDGWAIRNLQQLLRMASVEQARYSGEPYQRAAWFGQGLGQATIGYTESMSAMGDKGRETVAFKLMPLADRSGVSLFYADVIGINTSTAGRGKRALALKLANLMASTGVMLASMGPTSEDDDPQYLMPVRHSVFEELEPTFPLYGEMYRLVTEGRPELFRIGADSRDWLAAMKDRVRDEIFAAPGCQ